MTTYTRISRIPPAELKAPLPLFEVLGLDRYGNWQPDLFGENEPRPLAECVADVRWLLKQDSETTHTRPGQYVISEVQAEATR